MFPACRRQDDAIFTCVRAGLHRGSNLFDKRFFPVKYWIVIAYAVSCCLLPKQTPYDL